GDRPAQGPGRELERLEVAPVALLPAHDHEPVGELELDQVGVLAVILRAEALELAVPQRRAVGQRPRPRSGAAGDAAPADQHQPLTVARERAATDEVAVELVGPARGADRLAAQLRGTSLVDLEATLAASAELELDDGLGLGRVGPAPLELRASERRVVDQLAAGRVHRLDVGAVGLVAV